MPLSAVQGKGWSILDADYPSNLVRIARRFTTRVYEPGGDKYGDEWRNHSVAVIWDEDRDTRVLNALAYLVYAAPRTASRVSAIAERKGNLTVWAAWTAGDDWSAFRKASQNSQVLDSWPVEIRELVLPYSFQRFDIPTTILARDELGRSIPQNFDSQDEMILHINALYPLGWWGQPKAPTEPAAAGIG